MLRVQIKVKDKPEDVLEKIIGMIANNTGEVIESDEYGEAVFHVINVNTMSNTWSLKNA